jgi:hypothetical protein
MVVLEWKMRTLDEVIFEAPYSQTPWEADALHYLKEYRSKQDTIAEQLAELKQKNDHVCEMAITVCKAYERLCKRLAEEYRNDPLSWDELKAMEGKPVWVEALLYKQWAIIAYVGSDHIRFEGANLYAPESRAYMGDANGWQAYRKGNV